MKQSSGLTMAALSALAAVALLSAYLIGTGVELPRGPVAISWDKEPCAECHMLVGDPLFAAQVQLKDGTIQNFDDPGCALRFLNKGPHELHAVYFHHMRDDRWLNMSQAAFARGQKSPMGSGLGAVDKGTPSALNRDEAFELVLAQGEMP